MAKPPFSTRNDLAAATRSASIDALNANLLDLIDLHSQTKFAHWNVKGPHFIGLHKLFDEFAETLEEAIDAIAERAVALGGVANGTSRQVAAGSRVKEFPLKTHTDTDVVEALADRYAAVAKGLRKAIDDTEDDKDTSDLFTDHSREVDQALWMLEAHLQK